VPSAQQAENAEDNAEAVLDAEAVADGAAEAPPEPAQVSDEPVLTHTPKVRGYIAFFGVFFFLQLTASRSLGRSFAAPAATALAIWFSAKSRWWRTS
jgi:hypothetical protein